MDDGLVLSAKSEWSMGSDVVVLILVVVDDGLVPRTVVMNTVDEFDVLILVVVDDGLVHTDDKYFIKSTHGLNPCCSG